MLAIHLLVAMGSSMTVSIVRPALLQCACIHTPSNENAGMSNEAVVTRFIEEVINKGQLNTADEIVAEDFIELDPLPGGKPSREAFAIQPREARAEWRRRFPKLPLSESV